MEPHFNLHKEVKMFTESEIKKPIENAAADIFLERICGIINTGTQSVMISVGHRSGAVRYDGRT